MAVKKPTAAKAAAKPAAKKAAAKKENNSWIGEIEKYSRQIWLAGLGAYSKISNDGNKLFDGLVKDGDVIEFDIPGRRVNLLVDDEAGGLEHAVAGDLGVVGDLLDLGVETEVVEGLAGALLEGLAVLAAGAEDLDLHGDSLGQA